MIRIPDPNQLGPALAQVRDLLGMSRQQAAERMAEISGRGVKSCFSQIWTWDVGQGVPKMPAVAPYLEAMGVCLAIDFMGGSSEEADGEDQPEDPGRPDPAGLGHLPPPAGG